MTKIYMDWRKRHQHCCLHGTQ